MSALNEGVNEPTLDLGWMENDTKMYEELSDFESAEIGSDDDDQPAVATAESLPAAAVVAAPAAPVSAPQSKASTPGPSSSEDNTTSDSQKKRELKFGRVSRDKRCGKCPSCLNPQRKQACAVRRAQQEAGTAAPPSTTTSKATPAPREPKPQAAAPSGMPSKAFTSRLGRFLSEQGGVKQGGMAELQELLSRKSLDWPQRSTLIRVIHNSPASAKQEFVQSAGLLLLQEYLQEAVDTKKPKAVKRLLDTLEGLPITLASLEPPCNLGRNVAALRQFLPEEEDADAVKAVRASAKNLRKKWMTMYQQEQGGGGGGGAAGSNATATANTAVTPATSSAAAPRAAAAAAERSAKTPAAGTASAQTKPRVATKVSASLAEGDIFTAAERQRAATTAAAAAAKSAAATKTKPPVTALKRAAPAGAAPGAPAAKKPNSGTASSSITSSKPTTPLPPPPAAAVPPPPRSNPLDILTTQPIGMSTLGTASSLDRPLARPLTTSERARAAAARIPSPEPRPRKIKAKKLSWRDHVVVKLEDSNTGSDTRGGLVAVRLFRHTDPPAAARADALDDLASHGSDQEDLPPQFASAAKKEHLSEAKALRAHRQAEDEGRVLLSRRLDVMQPEIAWYDPPVNIAAVNPKLKVANGEESEEKQRRAAVDEFGSKYGASYPLPAHLQDQYPLQRHFHENNHPGIFLIPIAMHGETTSSADAAVATGPPAPVQHHHHHQHHHQHHHGHQQYQHQYQPPTHQHQYQPNHHTHTAAAPPSYQPQHNYQPPPPTAAAAEVASAPSGTGVPLSATAPAAALPAGVGDALAKLAASGALTAPVNVAGASGGAPAAQQYHQQLPAQQHRQVLPPGLRPMLGLHRQQAADGDGDSQQLQEATAAAIAAQLAHGHRPSGGVGGGLSRVPCRFFASGNCRHGDRCRFSHSLPQDADEQQHAAKRPRY